MSLRWIFEFDFGYGFYDLSREVEVAGCGAFGVYVVVDAIYLVWCQVYGGGYLFGVIVVVFAVEAKVHFVVGQGEIEFVLALGHGVGVGGWRTVADGFRDA